MRKVLTSCFAVAFLAACSAVEESLSYETCLEEYGQCLDRIEPSKDDWFPPDQPPLPARSEAVAQAMVDLCKIHYEQCFAEVERLQPK